MTSSPDRSALSYYAVRQLLPHENNHRLVCKVQKILRSKLCLSAEDIALQMAVDEHLRLYSDK